MESINAISISGAVQIQYDISRIFGLLVTLNFLMDDFFSLSPYLIAFFISWKIVSLCYSSTKIINCFQTFQGEMQLAQSVFFSRKTKKNYFNFLMLNTKSRNVTEEKKDD